MEKKNNYLLNVLIIILLLSSSRFLYIVPFPNIFLHLASNVLLCTLNSLIIFIAFGLIDKRIVMGNFGYEILILYLILILNMFFMYTKYNYSFFNIFMSIVPFGILLSYFPMVDFINSKDRFEFFLKSITIISVFLSIILLFQKYIYDTKGLIFLKIELPITFYGRFYDVSEGIIRISVLISAYQLLKNKFNILELVNLICSLLAIILVDQSRIYLMSVLIAIMVMIIINFKDNKHLNFLLYIILFFIIIFLVRNIYNSLTTTLGDFSDGSNYARRDAITYYLSMAREYFWTGLGLYVPSIGENYSALIKGPWGIYNYSDIGIVGIFASLGIFGILWYFWILIKSMIISWKLSINALNYGLIVEMIISMFTMTYFDSSRIFSLVLLLVIISSSSRLNNNLINCR